jgi:YbbR domain-containing protein
MTQVLQSILRDLPLKIVAVVTAVFIWFFGVLDRTYTTSFTVPVVLNKTESKRVISDIDTKSAVVTIEGKGKDLIGVHFRQVEFHVTPPEGKVGDKQLKLSVADLKLPSNVNVRSVNPENVELRMSEAASKAVAVQIPTTGQPASGLTVIVNRPATQVRLLGSEDDLKLVNAVYTETLNLASVTEPGIRRLRVLVPPGGFLGTEPESVDVNITTEKEGARIFLGVPVQVVAPEGRKAEIEPSEAQIAVAGPASRIDSLKLEDILAQVKVSGLQPGGYRLAAEISLPAEFHLVKCEPQLFDVTVR